MSSFSLQALHWTTDGELIPCDRLVLLNTLIRESLPDVQLELLRAATDEGSALGGEPIFKSLR